jgi:hypothetical protein
MSCADVQTIQAGNGSKTQFSFDFPYIFKSEIQVSFWNATTKEWDDIAQTDATYPWQVTDANPTIVEFTSTAPPAPAVPVNPGETSVDNVRIRRVTNIDDIRALFNPGSAIRSDDLNKNFEQLRYAIQEANCQGISDDIYQYLLDNYWDRFNNTIYSADTWVSNDSNIATTESIDQRIDTAITNDIGTDGTGITVTDDGDGTITLGLAPNSVDLDRIKNEDIVTYAEQNAGSPSWDSDSRIPTTYAAAKRHDCLVQTSTPSGSDWQIGKMWVQNDSDRTVHIWDGTLWLPLASGGAFTTLPKVVYVDSINGDDSYEAHRLSNPKKTIKSAIDAINADPDGDGSIVVVAPGIYGEEFPIDIQKNDVAVVGSSLRNCIIHPAIPVADQAGYDVDVPEANELQTMFRVNSGSYFYGLTLQGMKASGTRGGNALDTDPTYGLPTNQGWNFAFYPGAVIKKSPYIQNCTNFSDSQINNVTFTPHVPGEGAAGDLDSGFAGGGLLIDGSVPASNSPLRSMVCDSYTHTALNGPGIFITNNGYCQATSSYSFFNHYHLKTKNGGQANLAASTTDFGSYSLIADGRSTNAIFTAATTAGASTGDITFTIGAPSVGPDWHGAATRPQDNMLVDIGGNTYPVLSAVAAGSGWTVTISRPDPANLSLNLGLQNNVASGASASFYLRSMIASSGHTMEYVGSGTNYTALPENGGVPDESRQKTELNNGKIWAAITDHKGKFIVGDTFSVDQQTGFIETGSGSFAIPRLIVDLDLNGNNISDSTGNVVIDDTLSMNSNKIVDVTDPTNAQDAATKAYVDALETSLEAGQLDNLYFRQDTGETIESGDTWSSTDLSIATTAAIDARIVDLVDEVGGFVPINNENSFPATNPDINDGAGTLISIQEISTSRTPTGGTVTIPNGSGSNTVTINNCGTTVLAAGYGCIVETTSTLHTYNFHRLTPLATEVSTVAANVTPINTVATNISDVTTVSTNLADIQTVADDLNEPVSEIDTVATNITNVNSVGNNIGSVTTVSGSISNVNTVASDITNVNNTGTYIANVNTVAGQISPTNNVATVAGVASSIPTVAGVASSIPTVAGISSNVTTVAGISGNVTTVAGISSNVTTVANNSANVTTVATNITDVNTFANRYRIAASDPTTSLDTGDLVFNTTSNELRVYNGTSWQGGVTATGNLVSKSGDTMTGDLSFGGTQKVTNLATPSATGDAATKGYVDTAVSGIATDIDGLSDGKTWSTSSLALGALLPSNPSGAGVVSIGYGAGQNLSSGSDNVLIGRSAGSAITTGINSVHIGTFAGQTNTGSYNVGIGYQALRGTTSSSTGGDNTAIGYASMYSVTTGNSNVAYGNSALLLNTTGSSNVAIGKHALESNTVGARNTGIGWRALSANITGGFSTAVGFEALRNVDDYYNTALGYQAGNNIISGTNNLALGYQATASSSTVSNEVTIGNTSITKFRVPGIDFVLKDNGGTPTAGQVLTADSSGEGYWATLSAGATSIDGLSDGTTQFNENVGLGTGTLNSLAFGGQENTGLGYAAGQAITTSDNNTLIGSRAGQYNSASNNTAVGRRALYGVSGSSTGTANVAVGVQALQALTTGINNTSLGNDAGQNITTGSNNITLGNYAARAITTASRNIAIGNNAGFSNVSGSDSIYIGDNTGYNQTDGFNLAIGNYSMYGSAGSSATRNLCIGNNTGQSLTGSYNTIAGQIAGNQLAGGSDNSFFGYEAGRWVTTAQSNVFIGAQASGTYGTGTTTGSNNIVIGYIAEPSSQTVSNEVTIGNTSITKFRIPGIDFVLKDNGGTPTVGQVLTADASGEGYWADGGVTYELIEDGASKAAGSYIDISGYKAVYMICHNDTATNAANRNGPYLSTSNTSNTGVNTRNGRWWRREGYGSYPYDTASFSPSTSSLYYGSNTTGDFNKVWKLSLKNLNTNNVFIETSCENNGAFGSTPAYWNTAWSGVTTSGSSTWYLYIHQALLEYQIYGVK